MTLDTHTVCRGRQLPGRTRGTGRPSDGSLSQSPSPMLQHVGLQRASQRLARQRESTREHTDPHRSQAHRLTVTRHSGQRLSQRARGSARRCRRRETHTGDPRTQVARRKIRIEARTHAAAPAGTFKYSHASGSQCLSSPRSCRRPRRGPWSSRLRWCSARCSYRRSRSRMAACQRHRRVRLLCARPSRRRGPRHHDPSLHFRRCRRLPPAARSLRASASGRASTAFRTRTVPRPLPWARSCCAPRRRRSLPHTRAPCSCTVFA